MPRSGTVEAFDEARGLGTVLGSEGWLVPFHCTAIADGTRSIEPGTEVVYVLVAGHAGRYEARGLRPMPRSASGPGTPPGAPGSAVVAGEDAASVPVEAEAPSPGDGTADSVTPGAGGGDPPTSVLLPKPIDPDADDPPTSVLPPTPALDPDADPPTSVLALGEPTPPRGTPA